MAGRRRAPETTSLGFRTALNSHIRFQSSRPASCGQRQVLWELGLATWTVREAVGPAADMTVSAHTGADILDVGWKITREAAAPSASSSVCGEGEGWRRDYDKPHGRIGQKLWTIQDYGSRRSWALEAQNWNISVTWASSPGQPHSTPQG